jgi:hypothetical protein
MRTSYVAYGLQLDSFPLPGMTSNAAPGLPALAIERCFPEELDMHWSGAAGPPVWRGSVGDGTPLAIERGAWGDTLFTYGARARYLLDAARGTLRCAPAQDGLHWQQTLLARVLPNVAIECGYEALHASAVESPVGVVAIAAPSGMGKTTLAIELTRRGWPLVTDDVLVLEDKPQCIRAHPGAPHMNLAGGLSEQAPGATLGIVAGERWIAARNPCRGPSTLRAVCLLERGERLSLEAQPLPAGPLPLIPHMLGLRGDAARERRRFCTYATLAGSASLLRLTGSPSDPPGALADLIERELFTQPTVATAGMRL